MNTKFKVTALGSLGLVSILGLIMVNAASTQTTSRNHESECAEIIAYGVQFNHRILGLIRSNQTAKAATLLEDDVFLSLMQVWELQGLEGISSNRVTSETFRKIYPAVRQSVGAVRFENAIPSLRSNIVRFIAEADSVFLLSTNNEGPRNWKGVGGD